MLIIFFNLLVVRNIIDQYTVLGILWIFILVDGGFVTRRATAGQWRVLQIFCFCTLRFLGLHLGLQARFPRKLSILRDKQTISIMDWIDEVEKSRSARTCGSSTCYQ